MDTFFTPDNSVCSHRTCADTCVWGGGPVLAPSLLDQSINHVVVVLVVRGIAEWEAEAGTDRTEAGGTEAAPGELGSYN